MFLINAILNGLLSMITNLLNVLLLPINLIFENIFPDFTDAIANFNNFVTSYLGSILGFFFNLFPPIFKSILFLWFTFLGAYYGIRFAYLGAIKIFNIIQKIKFW